MPAPFTSWIYSMPLAQAWDDSPPPPPPEPVRPQMSFSDLQHGMRAYQSGETKDNGFRNGTLIMLAFVALVALVLHFRQRHKNAGPPDSMMKLGWELSRHIRFPFCSRFVLIWVGRSTKTPFPSLLISATLFDKAVNDWSSHHTFSAARHWGRSRLDRLRTQLFN